MAMLPNDGGEEKLREMFGPQQVDQAIRSALNMCWMSLPKERRNIRNVEIETRRIFDRAIANMTEDSGHFGFGNEGG
jgi:hypothetical protein